MESSEVLCNVTLTDKSTSSLFSMSSPKDGATDLFIKEGTDACADTVLAPFKTLFGNCKINETSVVLFPFQSESQEFIRAINTIVTKIYFSLFIFFSSQLKKSKHFTIFYTPNF